MLPIAGAVAIVFFKFQGVSNLSGIIERPLPIIAIAALILISICILIINSLLMLIIFDFGSVHMYKNGSSAWTAAWKVIGLVKANPFAMLIYLLSLMGIYIVQGMAGTCIVLLGCFLCCSCILLYILPFIWVLPLLPPLVFRRLFTLRFAAGAGDEFKLKELETSNS